MKKALSLILALAMALSLAACGGGKTETPSDSNTPADNTSAEPTKLSLILRGGTYADVIKECLPAFEAEHNVVCEVQELSEGDLYSGIALDAINDKGSYDLCMVDGSWMAEFTENEVKPIAAETDAKTLYPRENIEKLFDLGVMGMCIPKEYGGQGADPLASAICIEELSKQCASTGDIVATHNGLCCDPILTHGTEEQKAKYLPMLSTGHKVGAFALTEPNAGSDASKGQTEAKLEGDHYVMNGSKIFITNGYVADVFMVFAMTDKSKGTKGISAFIVESSFPGFSVGKHEEKMGLHGSPTAEIVFTDMIVPKENMLGREGKGFNIAMQTLDGGRIGIAAQSLGIAEGALEEAKAYTKGRVQFGKPISKFQNTQFTFADMELGCEAGRLLTYQAAMKKGAGERYTKEAAMAKLFCSEHAMKTTTKALQMFGGYGYTKDYPMERMMRDAKITEIYEGTSEVQRIVISANMGL